MSSVMYGFVKFLRKILLNITEVKTRGKKKPQFWI